MSRRTVLRTGSWVAWMLVLAATAQADGSDRLREVVDTWRETQRREIPLSVYLRPVVAADPHFNPDPGLALDHLSEAMQETWNGLQYLLTPDLKAQFLGLSSDSLRAEWLRRYWRLRDPTPTTPENERRREHERRIEYARTHYAWDRPPYWDARGRVYIMFGAPDSVIHEGADVREGVGYVPAHESWLYLDEKWVAEFEQPNPRGPWRFGKSSPSLSHRPDLVEEDLRRLGYRDALTSRTPSGRDRLSDLLGQEDERVLLAEKGLDRTLPRELVQHEVRTDLRARELLRKRREAVRSFTKELEAGTERYEPAAAPARSIWYVFDVDVFRGPPGRMRVEVHYQFNLQDLTFTWKDSIYVARYRVEGVLIDRDIREAARDVYQGSLTSEAFRSTLHARLLPGQMTFVVDPGTYRLALRFVDLESRDEGVYTTDVHVPPYPGEGLALSDLEMAARIVYAGDDWESRFVKRDRLVIPNPIGVYRRQQQLTGYFEIYGLTLENAGVGRYRVTYRIVPRGKVRQEGWLPGTETYEKPFVTSSFEAEAGTRDLVEELRVDISSLEQDAYDIVLTVRDLVAGTEASTRASFTLLD